MTHSDAAPVSRSVVDWRAAILAGLAAGLVFLMAEMILVALSGMSPWAPPRMMAAMVMGPDVLPPPATFDMGIMMGAMMVHIPLAIVYGIIFGVVASRLGTGLALAAGAAFGLALYVINFYGFTAVWPWFAMARNGISIFGHVLFGVVLAWSYKALTTRTP